MPSRGLLLDDLLVGGLVELGSQRLVDALAESLLYELTGLAAFTADKAFGLHLGLSGRGHGDLDEFQEAPPIWTVSRIDPSTRACSVTVCPRLRASMRAFSTAYPCKNESSSRWSPQRPLKLSN